MTKDYGWSFLDARVLSEMKVRSAQCVTVEEIPTSTISTICIYISYQRRISYMHTLRDEKVGTCHTCVLMKFSMTVMCDG